MCVLCHIHSTNYASFTVLTLEKGLTNLYLSLTDLEKSFIIPTSDRYRHMLLQPAILEPRCWCIGNKIVILNLHDFVEKSDVL